MHWCIKSLFSLSVLTKENLSYILVYLTKVWPLALSVMVEVLLRRMFSAVFNLFSARACNGNCAENL